MISPLNPMGDTEAAAASHIERRIDQLPMSRHLWSLVVLLSLGSFFEIYELSLTSLIAPGLVKAGIFARENGMFGLPDQATFAAATFLGMFVGAMVIGRFADRMGRKWAFTVSIILYTVATLSMALQHSALEINVCRFLAGIGLGAEVVTVDVYLAEIVPARYRGRAFAFATFFQFVAVPIVAGLCFALVPRQPFGIEGWRWVCFIGGLGGILVLLTRARLPESPRWLAQQGLLQRAAHIVGTIERKSGVIAVPLMPLMPEAAKSPATQPAAGARSPRLFDPAWRRNVVTLTIANVLIGIGFFGLASWLPSLLVAQGHTIVKSFEFTFYITMCYPLCPLLFMFFADKIERKWLIAGATLGSSILGLVFGQQSQSFGIVVLGLGVTISNLLTAYGIRTYQSELFPSPVRAKAVGFVSSWGRLATVFSSLLIGYLLQTGGTNAVFIFLAACFATVSLLIAVAGPRTLQRTSVVEQGSADYKDSGDRPLRKKSA